MRLNGYRKLRQMPNNLSNFRIQDAANYLGVSSKTLRRWGKSGKLVSKRSEGGHRYYTREQLDNFRFADKTETVVSPSPLKNKDHTLALSFTVIMLCIGLTGFNGTGAFKVSSENNTSYNKQQANNKDGQYPSVLAATTEGITPSVAGFTFAVNVPSKFSETVTFLKDIVAPNVVNSVNDETGDITIDNSLVAGSGISITDRTISNSGIVTLSAGTGISVDGNKITNTYSFTPDYTQGGWTRTGTTVGLTTITDSVTVGALTAGAVTVDSLTTGGLSLTSDLTVSSGNSLLPAVDLGSDIGNSTHRFNNLWVANINSNSSQSFSGQTTFSYPPTDTTIDEASVLINPTTSIANGQLLGLAIAGYEKAVIDEDGDIILGYNSLTSPPATDYPLDIYGHSGTRVAYVNTSGVLGLGGESGSRIRSDSNGLISILGASAGYGGIKVKDGTASAPGYSFGNYEGLVGMYTELGSLAFSTNSTERIRITTSGNVGIGTTSPSYKLDVNGIIKTAGSSENNPSLLLDDTNTGLYSSSDILYLVNAGVWRWSISETHLSARSGARMIYGAAALTTPSFTSSADTNTGLAFSDSDALSLLTGGVQRLNINSSGNVGIGTTSPGTLLTLGGNIADTNKLRTYYMATQYPTLYGEIFHGGDDEGLALKAYGDVGYTGSGSIQFYTDDDSTPEFRMKIDKDGNVGIGTTAPQSKLDVRGEILTDYISGIGFYNTTATTAKITSSGDADLQFKVGASAFEKMRITYAGNVGIGTTSPGAKLDVNGISSFRSVLRLYENDTFTGYLGRGNYIFSDASNNDIGLLATDSIHFGVGGDQTTTDMIINSSGNVGIGTTSPISKLQIGDNIETGPNIPTVAGLYSTTDSFNILRIGRNTALPRTLAFGASDTDGFAEIQAFQSKNSWSNTPLVLQRQGGNVGIGTTSPSTNLDVSNTGNVKITARSTNSGQSALQIGNDSGNRWSFMMDPAVDSRLRISYGASELYSFGTTGNVGIGTTSPASKLHILGTSAQMRVEDTGGTSTSLALRTGVYDFGITNSGLLTTFSGGSTDTMNLLFNASDVTNQLYLSTTGNVGIGTTSPTFSVGGTSGLHVHTSTSGYNSEIRLSNGATGSLETDGAGLALGTSGTLYLKNLENSPLAFYTNNTERFRIDASGNVGIGTTAPGEKLEVTGNIKTSSLTTGTVYSNAGVLTNTDPSDINLKTNVLNLPDGTLNKVLGLRTVSYNWKSTGDGALGFVAQEVQQVFPELVGTNNDGTLGLYTTQFIPLLTKAIQEQQLQIDEVKLSSASATITNEEWDEQKTKLDDFIAYIETIINGFKNKFVTKQSIQEELCIGTEDNKTCLNKEKIDTILNNLPSPTSTVAPTDSPVAAPLPSSTPEPSPTASPSASPSTETIIP